MKVKSMLVREAYVNNIRRMAIKTVVRLLVLLCISIVLFAILLKAYSLAFGAGVLAVYLYYILALKCKIVRIHSLHDQTVVLADKGKMINIMYEDISYVQKYRNFSFGDHFLFIMVLKDTSAHKTKRFMFYNEPKANVVDVFRRKNVVMKHWV